MNENNFQSGQIVKASVNSFPLIFHYGIILKDNNQVFIIHNSPDAVNLYGGNVLISLLSDWLTTRKIVSIQSTNLTNEQINYKYEELKARKYNFLTFNCEHFIDYMLQRDIKSEQLDILKKILIAIGILFAIRLIFFSNH